MVPPVHASQLGRGRENLVNPSTYKMIMPTITVMPMITVLMIMMISIDMIIMIKMKMRTLDRAPLLQLAAN